MLFCASLIGTQLASAVSGPTALCAPPPPLKMNNPNPPQQQALEQKENPPKAGETGILAEMQLLCGALQRSLKEAPELVKKLQQAIDKESVGPPCPEGEKDAMLSYDIALTTASGTVVRLRGVTPMHQALTPSLLPALVRNVESVLSAQVLVPLNAAAVELVEERSRTTARSLALPGTPAMAAAATDIMDDDLEPEDLESAS